MILLLFFWASDFECKNVENWRKLTESWKPFSLRFQIPFHSPTSGFPKLSNLPASDFRLLVSPHPWASRIIIPAVGIPATILPDISHWAEKHPNGQKSFSVKATRQSLPARTHRSQCGTNVRPRPPSAATNNRPSSRTAECDAQGRARQWRVFVEGGVAYFRRPSTAVSTFLPPIAAPPPLLPFFFEGRGVTRAPEHEWRGILTLTHASSRVLTALTHSPPFSNRKPNSWSPSLG